MQKITKLPLFLTTTSPVQNSQNHRCSSDTPTLLALSVSQGRKQRVKTPLVIFLLNKAEEMSVREADDNGGL